MHKHFAPYAVSILCVAVATAIRALLDPYLESGQVFSLYYAAVAVTAWYGGVRPALVSMILGFLAADWFFAEPRGSVILQASDADAWVALAMYCGVSLGIMSLVAIRRGWKRPAIATAQNDEFLALAAAVRVHGLNSRDLPNYLAGLNASPEACTVAAQCRVFELDSIQLADRLEKIAQDRPAATV